MTFVEFVLIILGLLLILDVIQFILVVINMYIVEDHEDVLNNLQNKHPNDEKGGSVNDQ